MLCVWVCVCVGGGGIGALSDPSPEQKEAVLLLLIDDADFTATDAQHTHVRTDVQIVHTNKRRIRPALCHAAPGP